MKVRETDVFFTSADGRTKDERESYYTAPKSADGGRKRSFGADTGGSNAHLSGGKE
ncbi:MAG: hypothetical protein IJY62_06785 [Clostridia bacterium]|nr:hypothetical protein [Clostridia bacterium]